MIRLHYLNNCLSSCAFQINFNHCSKKSKKLISSLELRRCLATSPTLNSKPAFQLIDRKKKPKVTNPLDAVSSIQSGSTIFAQMGVSTSQILLNALTTHIKENKLTDIRVHQLLTLGAGKGWKDVHESGQVRGNSFFTSGDNRSLINSGKADYTPIFLSDASRYFSINPIQLDAVITQVSPADKFGYHTLGGTLVCAKEAIENSKLLICQVNKNQPCTRGDTVIHESQIDVIVEADTPLPELPVKEYTDEDIKIGKLIAENFVEDGSTLQMGIGSIPDMVLKFCDKYKNLGIHSEMVSDGVVDLYECGAVTNHLKVIEKDHTLVNFALGTNKIYKYLDNNPSFIFKSGSYVNDERLICQNPKIVAINSCIEMDILGQAASDMVGRNVYSGVGGQVDFLRGASMSKDGKGKPILAFHSTTKGQSKIVLDLKQYSGVTSTRANVWYVVTEYGIANLFGKTMRQRAYELIQIAHPDYRETLEKGAFDRLKCMPSKD